MGRTQASTPRRHGFSSTETDRLSAATYASGECRLTGISLRSRLRSLRVIISPAYVRGCHLQQLKRGPGLTEKIAVRVRGLSGPAAAQDMCASALFVIMPNIGNSLPSFCPCLSTEPPERWNTPAGHRWGNHIPATPIAHPLRPHVLGVPALNRGNGLPVTHRLARASLVGHHASRLR
jgi:hypothetical protein